MRKSFYPQNMTWWSNCINCNSTCMGECATVITENKFSLHNVKDKLITITGKGSFSFKILASSVPSHSFIYHLSGFTGFSRQTKRNGIISQLPLGTAYLPFLDGILRLIFSYFFTQPGEMGLQHCNYKSLPQWPNPMVPEDFNSIFSIELEDIQMVDYITALGTLNFSNTYFDPKFKKLLSTVVTNDKILPLIEVYDKHMINRMFYPTATFINVLSIYLGLYYNIRDQKMIKSFGDDFKAVKKLVKDATYLREPAIDDELLVYSTSLKQRINLLNNLWEEIGAGMRNFKTSKLSIRLRTEGISGEIAGMQVIDYHQELERTLLKVAYPILEKFYEFFKNAIYITNKKNSHLFSKLDDTKLCDDLKRIDSIYLLYECDYVDYIQKMYNMLRLYFGYSDYSSKSLLSLRFEEKYCCCSPAKTCHLSGVYYSAGSLVDFLVSDYTGCDKNTCDCMYFF